MTSCSGGTIPRVDLSVFEDKGGEKEKKRRRGRGGRRRGRQG